MGDDRITLLQKFRSMYPYTHEWYFASFQYCDRRLPLLARNLRDWSTGSRLADLIGHRHTASTFAIVKQMLLVVLLLSIGVVPHLTCNSVRSHTNSE